VSAPKWQTNVYPDGGRYWWLTVKQQDAHGPEWCYDIDEKADFYLAVFYWGADTVTLGTRKTLPGAQGLCVRHSARMAEAFGMVR
jgi:hypothetical protein